MTEAAEATPASARFAPPRRVLGRLRDRVAASDPALSRLRIASRAVLSMIVNGLLLAGITMLHGLPIAAYGLAVVISFIGSLAVRDSTPKGKAVTRAMAGVAAVLSMLTASLLSPTPLLADIAFLCIIFAAVFARGYGPRGFAIGMLAFMAYFLGDYLRPPPAEMGWVALAAAIALTTTHVVGRFVLVDDPERDFRRAMVTIDRRINLILGDLRQAARTGRLGERARKGLIDHVTRLRDIVLMAEGFIPQGPEGSLAAEGPASELAVELFDLQLAVERLVAASSRALPSADLVAAVQKSDGAGIAAATRDLGGDGEAADAATQRVLLRVHKTRQRLATSLEPSPAPAFRVKPGEAAGGGGGGPGQSGGRKGLVPQRYHVPIQVTLASAIAMASGPLVSSTRWYWAVLAAFIVFNNTRSRADTAVRALQRSAGTLAGLVGGTLVATLLHGHMIASGVGILVAFFLGLYFLQASYGVMIFFVTIAIALLYGLMGRFSPELLVVRLEETVIGAAAGVLTAFFVFPKRATTGVSAALDDYLDALAELVATARGTDEGGDPLAASRRLDRALSDLATAARPLGGPWTVVTRFGNVRERLLLLTGCAHWGRALARSLSRGEIRPADETASVAALADVIDARIGRIREVRGRFFSLPTGRPVNMPSEPRRGLARHEDEGAVVALEVIGALLRRLAPPEDERDHPPREAAPTSP